MDTCVQCHKTTETTWDCLCADCRMSALMNTISTLRSQLTAAEANAEKALAAIEDVRKAWQEDIDLCQTFREQLAAAEDLVKHWQNRFDKREQQLEAAERGLQWYLAANEWLQGRVRELEEEKERINTEWIEILHGHMDDAEEYKTDLATAREGLEVYYQFITAVEQAIGCGKKGNSWGFGPWKLPISIHKLWEDAYHISRQALDKIGGE